MGAENYGKYYWCAKVKPGLSPDNEIYVMADSVRVGEAGTLEFLSDKDYKVNLIIAAEEWRACYAASVIDGSAIAVEYWQGEVTESRSEEKGEGESRARSKERGKITKSLRYDILKRDGFSCQLCGAKGGDAELVLDHIVPIAKGGKSTRDNLRILCRDCNSGKGQKLE